MTLHVLKIGDPTRAEAAPLSKWISQNLRPADVRESLTFPGACTDILRTKWIPDLVIVFQAWSDEYAPSDLTLLFSIAPLARVTVCQGAWCESDGRTRQVWPVALRTSMTSAPDRLMREWRALSMDVNVPVILPSASRDEVFDVDHPPVAASKSLSIAIDSPDPAYRDYLIEFLQNIGCTAEAFHESNETLDALVFDADPLPVRSDRIQKLHNRYARVPIVALVASPQYDDVATLMQCGATSVLPKLGNQQSVLVALSSNG